MLRAGLISKATDSLKPQSEHAILGDERPAVASSPLYSARCRAKTTVAPGSVIAKAGSTGDDGGSRTAEGRNAAREGRRLFICSGLLRELHGKHRAARIMRVHLLLLESGSFRGCALRWPIEPGPSSG
jgi:hypothetical protein